MISDFYGSYTVYAGKHQRCWVHFLRDLHNLKEAHLQNSAVIRWVQDVRAVYDDAQAWLQSTLMPTCEQREVEYIKLVERAHQLGVRHAQATKHPCRALAKRILRHEAKLFQFVLVAGVPAHNNLAERGVRPLVVIRKISGGSRSAEGTKTRMALASLFETWQARGLNPFDECLTLLRQTSLPQI